MNNTQKYFIVTDFDGTLAATFDDSPRGMNVHVASDHAVHDVFGTEGHRVYEEIGGLKNREPGELVRLISQEMKAGTQGLSVKDLTERYVKAKLSYLVPEISNTWPRLYPGVKEFFQLIEKGRFPISIGVVSSGHDGFIRTVFDVNGLRPPHVVVSSDLLASREMPKRERYKPNTYQLAEAHRQWELLQKTTATIKNGERYDGRNHGKPNILYIGDDPIKDGGLAEQARVPFIFVPFTKPGFEPNAQKGQLLAPDFFMLNKLLLKHEIELKEGKSFASIIFRREDTELFPHLVEGQRPYDRWIEAGRGNRRERGF